MITNSSIIASVYKIVPNQLNQLDILNIMIRLFEFSDWLVLSVLIVARVQVGRSRMGRHLVSESTNLQSQSLLYCDRVNSCSSS
jgi:hypothetical protein